MDPKSRTARRQAKGLAEAQANGHIYFQHAGEQITQVFVFRVGITQIIDGVPTWVYSAAAAAAAFGGSVCIR